VLLDQMGSRGISDVEHGTQARLCILYTIVDLTLLNLIWKKLLLCLQSVNTFQLVCDIDS
jgi:hypothetical protein